MKVMITSTQNELVRATTKLHNARTRQEMRRFLVEGTRACEPFLKSRFSLIQLFITEEHQAWATALGIDTTRIFLTTSRVIRKLSTATTPSGVVGVFDIPDEIFHSKKIGSGIVLAQIQDPGNAGTLIRTAAALDATVVVVDGVDIFNPKVIQASAGALAYAKLVQLDWHDLVTEAHSQSIALTALVVKEGIDLRQLPTQKARLLVIGNEAHGISDAWLKDCSDRATLVMPGQTESLNAAVAGSIALYLSYLWNK